MTRPDLVDALKAALGRSPATAKELARALGATRGDVNSALYSQPDAFIGDGASPPTWALKATGDATASPSRADEPPRSKQAVVDAILKTIGSRSAMAVGPGSTEPKAVFVEAVRALRLPLDEDLSKVDLARGIVSAAGGTWPKDGDSTGTPSGGGDTVTLTGLAATLSAVRQLREAVGASAPLAQKPIGGVTYIESVGGVDAPPALIEQDWDALDRATRAHMDLQNRIAAIVASAGLVPLSPAPGDPQYDIAWKPRGRFVVCEVKSSNEDNARQQLRLGLGQVIEYRTVLASTLSVEVIAAIACETLPPVATRRAIASAGVRLVGGASLESDLGALL